MKEPECSCFCGQFCLKVYVSCIQCGLGVEYSLPWVAEVFFLLGATELSGKAALLALTLLTAGEREDLWYPG